MTILAWLVLALIAFGVLTLIAAAVRFDGGWGHGYLEALKITGLLVGILAVAGGAVFAVTWAVQVIIHR